MGQPNVVERSKEFNVHPAELLTWIQHLTEVVGVYNQENPGEADVIGSMCYLLNTLSRYAKLRVGCDFDPGMEHKRMVEQEARRRAAESGGMKKPGETHAADIDPVSKNLIRTLDALTEATGKLDVVCTALAGNPSLSTEQLISGLANSTADIIEMLYRANAAGYAALAELNQIRATGGEV